eukprot:2544-Heterococcus_DN1.PRE.3
MHHQCNTQILLDTVIQAELTMTIFETCSRLVVNTDKAGHVDVLENYQWNSNCYCPLVVNHDNNAPNATGGST